MFGPLDLLLPPIVLLTAVLTLPFTIATVLVQGQFHSLITWSKLRHSWFKHFWWWFGPASKPLFTARVRPILAQAKGVVLDIGPASGIWMPEMSQVVREKKITKVYGVEPNVNFHHQLRSAAKRYGIADVYEPIPVYAQDLESCGIEKGTVDTVITVHVLCSVGTHAEELVKELYGYLRPGGQWLVYEHVASRRSPTRWWQAVNNTLWPTLLDGCDLCQNTQQTLLNAGAWQTAEIHRDANDGYFESLPHVYGRLVKAL